MTDNTIELATGKTLLTDYFVPHEPSKSVYFTVLDMTEDEIRTILGNPEESERMTYKGKVYEGFTRLREVEPCGTAFKVRMTQNG